MSTLNNNNSYDNLLFIKKTRTKTATIIRTSDGRYWIITIELLDSFTKLVIKIIYYYNDNYLNNI